MAQPAFSAVGSRIEGPQASTSSPARAPVEAKIPYSLTKEYGEARFDEMYEKALLRKRLFKEYLMRHQVLERLNQAIEAVFDCEVLPEDPMEYILAYVKAPPPQRPTSKRSTGGGSVRPALALTSGGGAGPASPQR